MNALHGVVDHVADRFEHFLITERLDVVLVGAEQEMQRHHAGLRRDRRGIGGRDDREIDIAGSDQLQDLRFLPELRAGILIDQHGSLAQFLELGGKYIVGDAVAGIELLIVGEAIMLGLLCARTRRERHRRRRNGQTYHSLQSIHCVASPCLDFCNHPIKPGGLSIKQRCLGAPPQFEALEPQQLSIICELLRLAVA